MARRNKPNCSILWEMQEYSIRGWVYREGQGWVFADPTPEERAEFKLYQCGITIPRMRVRLPYSSAWRFIKREPDSSDNFANWFAYCTMPHTSPLIRSRFRMHQMTGNEHTWYPVAPGSYETWLWADEVKICREVGCEVTVHNGYGWREWDVPDDWKAPLTAPPRHPRLRSAEYSFIYALIDELTQEVGYVGRSENPEQRLLSHLRDSNNPVRWAWIQRLLAQGRKPKLLILEKVAVAVEDKREQFWISYYWKRGHHLTNDKCEYWHKPDEEEANNLSSKEDRM